MTPQEYLVEHADRFLEDLKGWLAIPSISALADHKPDMERAAQHLVEMLKARGVQKAETRPTSANPVVYAEHIVDAKLPTLLIYGHYDVMPVDPLDEWSSKPFEAEVRGEMLYGRGTADDKGQVMVHLNATEALLKAGQLPVNLKFIVEGGEEVGSPGLAEYLESHREELACDAVLVSDTPMSGLGEPSVCVGLRGLCYMEIFLTGPTTDLHSGSFGGAVENPASAMAHLLASLKGADGKILIDGFYDDVRELSAADKEAIAKAAPSDQELIEATGSPKLHGEPGFTPTERIWARPSLDINGVWSGFIGEGAKTVIPSLAGAKISMRLVADQDPDKAAELFEAHVRKHAPDTVTLKVVRHHGGWPYLARVDGPVVAAASEALEEVFGKAPQITREGGSIPIVVTLAEKLGVDVLLMGVGYPGECSHAPDEHLPLDHLNRGSLATLRLYQICAEKLKA